MQEPLPLATIHRAVFSFLSGRDDAVLFGAQAVNVYVDEPRMTQDVDILCSDARALAEEVRVHLATEFSIAVRVREVANGRGYRVYQIRKPRNRHLVDVRHVDVLPPSRQIEGLRVLSPEELIAMKLVAYERRRGRPKSGTDWRDLAMLLLTFPALKDDPTPVADRLRAAGSEPSILSAWERLAASEILPEDEDGEFL